VRNQNGLGAAAAGDRPFERADTINALSSINEAFFLAAASAAAYYDDSDSDYDEGQDEDDNDSEDDDEYDDVPFATKRVATFLKCVIAAIAASPASDVRLQVKYLKTALRATGKTIVDARTEAAAAGNMTPATSTSTLVVSTGADTPESFEKDEDDYMDEDDSDCIEEDDDDDCALAARAARDGYEAADEAGPAEWRESGTTTDSEEDRCTIRFFGVATLFADVLVMVPWQSPSTGACETYRVKDMRAVLWDAGIALAEEMAAAVEAAVERPLEVHAVRYELEVDYIDGMEQAVNRIYETLARY